MCDRTLGYCEQSESACRETLKKDQELITELIKQRNEAISDAITNRGSSTLDIITFVVLGVAGGVILTRGLR